MRYIRLRIPTAGAIALLAGGLLAAQNKYNGPRPPKPDIPYLLHATNLLETEVGEAVQSDSNKGTTYTVQGASSPARTPVPEPIFLFQPGKLNPDRLSCYRMEVKSGARTLTIPSKRGKNDPKPVYILVTPLDRGLFRVEVNEPIEEGEYCLTPDGSNTVFCFSLY